MRCPRCKTDNPSNLPQCDSCGVVFADIRNGAKQQEPRIPRVTCGWPSCNRESTSRHQTPTGWLNICDTHYVDYWRATPRNGEPNGFVDEAEVKRRDKRPSYRQRWYAERGLPYEEAKPMRALSPAIQKVLAPWTAMTGRVPRERQPGEDEDYKT